MVGAARPVTAAATSARTMNGVESRSITWRSCSESSGEPTCGVWSWRSIVRVVVARGPRLVERRAVVATPGRGTSPRHGRPAGPSARARGRRARSSRRAPSARRASAPAPRWLGRSTPAVGSSRKNASGSPARARAISTRCCCPPESVATLSAARSARPTTSSASSMARRSARESGASSRRRPSRPDATTSRTEVGHARRGAGCAAGRTRSGATRGTVGSGVPKSSTLPARRPAAGR